jgi:hypothetical protein
MNSEFREGRGGMTSTASRVAVAVAVLAIVGAGATPAWAARGPTWRGHGTAQHVRTYEPPDPCLQFHGRRAHAHCVSGLTSGKRRHDRLDPYKN